MGRSCAWLAAAVLGLGFVVPDRPAGIAWESDYDGALKKAQTEKRPLMIVFLMDNEPANDEVATAHFQDPDVIAQSKHFVCLIASAGTHPGPATDSRPVCGRFGSCTCSQHTANMVRAMSEFIDSPGVSTPQFIFLKPDGKTVLLRHVWMLPAPELVKKMRLAAGLQDPTVEKEAVAAVRSVGDDLLKRCDDKNAVKRQAAMQELAACDDPRVIDFLIKQTAEGVEEAKRLEAIEAMGNAKNGRTLPVLHKLLASQVIMVRLAVAKTLERLAVPESSTALLAAVKKEGKLPVRGQMVKTLVACDAVSAPISVFVASMIRSTSQSDRLYALKASAKLAVNPELKKAWLAAATDSNTPVRALGWWLLGKKNIAEGAALIRGAVANEKNADARHIGEYTLATLAGEAYTGPDPESAVSTLMSTAGC